MDEMDRLLYKSFHEHDHEADHAHCVAYDQSEHCANPLYTKNHQVQIQGLPAYNFYHQTKEDLVCACLYNRFRHHSKYAAWYLKSRLYYLIENLLELRLENACCR